MAKKHYNWEVIKNDWLITNLLSSKQMPLVDFAKKHDVNIKTLTQKVSDGKWSQVLKKKQSDLQKSITTQVLAKAKKDKTKNILDELKVREENFKIATAVLDPIIKEWQRRVEKDPKLFKKMSNSGLVSVIKTCLTLRKESAGLPDKVTIEHTTDENHEFQTVSDHIKSHEDKLKLLSIIKGLMDENKELKEFNTVDV